MMGEEEQQEEARKEKKKKNLERKSLDISSKELCYLLFFSIKTNLEYIRKRP